MKEAVDLYRVELYVLDLNGQVENTQYLKSEFQSMRYLDFVTVADIKVTSVRGYDDNHPLNQTGCDHSTYFPEVYPGVGDAHLKAEYQRVRDLMMIYIKKNDNLARENIRLNGELEKLNKVKEFVNGLKERL
jgi:hypothetical protein